MEHDVNITTIESSEDLCGVAPVDIESSEDLCGVTSKACTIAKCFKKSSGDMLKCDTCKGSTHFVCTKLPLYFLYLLSAKGCKRFRCENCVGDVPTEFEIFANGDNDLDCKEKVIESMKLAYNTLRDLADDKDELIKNQKRIIESMQNNENNTGPMKATDEVKDTIIKELNTALKDMKCELESVVSKNEQCTSGHSKMVDAITKESDRKVLKKEEELAATLKELEKSEFNLSKCKEEIDKLKTVPDATNTGLADLSRQLGAAEQLNRDLGKRLDDQALILSKTELAFESKTELLKAKDEIIGNLKSIIENLRGEVLEYKRRENEKPNLTSFSVDVDLTKPDQQVGSGDNRSGEGKSPGTEKLENSVKDCCDFLHNHGTNGAMFNGFLTWADIQRKSVPENIWKIHSMKSFTKEEISLAKEAIWRSAGDSLIGKMIRRQGENKSQAEVNDICVALKQLAEKDRLPMFLSTSDMIAQTPIYMVTSEHENIVNSNSRLHVIEETLNSLIESNCSNGISVRLEAIEKDLSTNNNHLKVIETSIDSLKTSMGERPHQGLSGYNSWSDAVRGNSVNTPVDNTIITPGKHVSWADIESNSNFRTHIDLSTSASHADREGRVYSPPNTQYPVSHPGTRTQIPSTSEFLSGNGTSQMQYIEPIYQGQNQYAPFNESPQVGILKEIDKGVVYGTNQDTSLTAADVEIVVFGVAKDVSCYQIASYAEKQGIKIINCELLTSWDEARSNTFKLTVKATQAETALSEAVWPLGVGIRRFTKQKVNTTKNHSRWNGQGRMAQTQTQKGLLQNNGTAQQQNRAVFQQTTQKNQNRESHLFKEDRRNWLRQNSGRK